MKRCALCGNETRAIAPVEHHSEVCVRCLDVIKDRTANMALGPHLLPTERTIWQDGQESGWTT